VERASPGQANAEGITLLTAEHVHTRRRGDELLVIPLDDERRTIAHNIAESYAELAKSFVGKDRQSFLDASKALASSWDAKDRKLSDGLLKLVTDRCAFEEETPLDSPHVRAVVFERAAAIRRSANDPASFDRATVLERAAHDLGHPAVLLEAALYGDLPGAHILKQVMVPPPGRLLEIYDLAQIQAVLLRATRVVVNVAAADPSQFRTLFRTLKFHQLLFTIAPVAKGGYQITLDGPFSMFDAVTRYGLKLAMALPAIMSCDVWSFTAEVLWGKERELMRFRQKGNAKAEPSSTLEPVEAIKLLLERWPALNSEWTVQPCSRILDFPGVGLCVPDLEFCRADGTTVYFELLGYWSRDAVWKRVELAQAGLPFAVVFGVSRGLRVSESVLGDESSSCLYVFSKIPNARSLLERIERVAVRAR
jgi:uncharacterized protein